MTNREKHIVLDLDGTLVFTRSIGSPCYGQCDPPSPLGALPDFTCDGYLATYKRPGLDAFLDFCFDRFASVSLWTAGTDFYAWYIAQNICATHRPFASIRSADDCVVVDDCLFKPLRLLWASPDSNGACETNTIIVEDQPSYCALNPRNAIIVGSYGGGPWDYTLSWLKYYLERFILPVDNVAEVDTRRWMKDTKASLIAMC